MISKVGQIMLYVNNQDAAKAFWTEKVGFTVIAEEDNGQGMRWIEVGPTGAATSIVLQNKELVAKMEPDMNLGTPSLMFFTDNVDQLYADLSNKNVKVGEVVSMPSGEKVFNFADDEENYFAVMEKK
ncbi:VOC family protein [Paenibacillus xerothermodurans]|uniref:VOC family protein n=1 Tax=Paenibacillus xerothermodurans TaxID=1977292 RepID=A0A2W1NKH7_PAEXE|nr:VOC family protein [Paenibacillus xerothermodurans]PZE19895.1 VOC family protein [Paenibacillus xerothermodurans]